MKIVALVGARPNFIKIEALYRAFSANPKVDFILTHTGQHKGLHMSDVFFQELHLPKPDFFLNISRKSPHTQIAQIISRFGDVLKNTKPDAVLLVGDVNSTLAGAIAANKTDIPFAHVEAGLRSGDKGMPEEHNRIVADHLANWLFTTEKAGNTNLAKENIAPEKVHFVGNVMIDALVHHLPQSRLIDFSRSIALKKGKYVLCTIHRGFNIKNIEPLQKIVGALKIIAQKTQVVLPLHPHTKKCLLAFGMLADLKANKNIKIIQAVGYLEFLNLQENAAVIITDSGGVQEESCFLGVPCLTFRPNTERPITLENGINRLVYHETKEQIAEIAENSIHQRIQHAHQPPPLWDGNAATRIAKIMLS